MLSDSLQGLRGTSERLTDVWNPARGGNSQSLSSLLPGKPQSPVLGVVETSCCLLTKSLFVGSSKYCSSSPSTSFTPFALSTTAPISVAPLPNVFSSLPANLGTSLGSSPWSLPPVPKTTFVTAAANLSAVPVPQPLATTPIPTDPRRKPRPAPAIVPDSVLTSTLAEELDYCFERINRQAILNNFELKTAFFKKVQKALYTFNSNLSETADSLGDSKPVNLPHASRKRTYSDSFGSDPLDPPTPPLTVRAATSLTSSQPEKEDLNSFLNKLPPGLEDLPLPDLGSVTSAELFGDFSTDEQAAIDSN